MKNVRSLATHKEYSSDWADTQADLGVCWAHRSICQKKTHRKEETEKFTNTSMSFNFYSVTWMPTPGVVE